VHSVGWRQAAIVGVALVVMAAVGLAVTKQEGTPDAASRGSPPAPEPFRSFPGAADPETVTIPAVLDFEARLLDGGVLQGAEYASTGVALWFWAPW
jgi:hypothetical protein